MDGWMDGWMMDRNMMFNYKNVDGWMVGWMDGWWMEQYIKWWNDRNIDRWWLTIKHLDDGTIDRINFFHSNNTML